MTVNTETGEISPTPYQLLPRLTDDEYAALKADIAENGIRVPIDVDEFGTILDGHHRSWIAADLHVTCPQRRVAGLTDEQKRAHAIAVNIHRRNLTGEQRRDLILRMRCGGMSLTMIADATAVDESTVRRALASTSANPEVELPSRITSRNGKSMPASRPSQVDIDKRRDLAAQLRDQGLTFAQIAEAVGVAASTISNDFKALEDVGPDVTGRTTADRAARLDKIRELASSGHSSQQIARAVDRTVEQVRVVARQNSIEIPADKVIGRTRRIDSNKVMTEIVADLEQLALPIRLINFDDLDAARAEEWANSLTDSIRALNRFTKQIKELTQ